MVEPGQAVMADWLALHGMGHQECLARLQGIRIPPQRPADDPAFPRDRALPTVLQSLLLALPGAAGMLDRIRTEVRIDLAPDPKRFPRAFTLHDDGRGLPYVCCPLKGRLSDLLVLAHEIGHACQLLASRQPDLPPLQREMAAYLAEEIIREGLAVSDARQGAALDGVDKARTRRIMLRDGAALLHGLRDPVAAYGYGWNYPIARDLAARAAAHLSAADRWRVFAGTIGLPRLLQLPPVSPSHRSATGAALGNSV